MSQHAEKPPPYEPLSLRYIKIRGWAAVLNSIHIICLTYCLSTLLLPSDRRLPPALEYWAIAETAFYLVARAYRTFYIQRPASHPVLPTAEQRLDLFTKSLDTTGSHEHYISKWFLGAPLTKIRRENLREFLRWAFFSVSEKDKTYDAEIEDYLEEMESRSGLHFEEGRSSGVKSLRLTVDPVHALHRSLTWYFCILVVDVLTHAWQLSNGFTHYRTSALSSLTMLPPRLHTLVSSRRSPSEHLSYYYRPHTASKELPILFLHGIGVGLWPYVDFFRELNESRSKEDGQIGILAIEILPISSRLTSPILRKEAMCQQIEKILDHHGFEEFLLMTHSYGSVIATHLLKLPSISPRISSMLLVDPITILLSQPDVAYNFTVRKPYTAQEWLIWYYGAKDIGVAHTLGRHFFWHDNILWKEDLVGRRAAVFLSSDDCIVDARAVRGYLLDKKGSGQSMNGIAHARDSVSKETPHAAPQQTVALFQAESHDPKVLWGQGLDHAQVFDVPAWRQILRQETLTQTRIT